MRTPINNYITAKAIELEQKGFKAIDKQHVNVQRWYEVLEVGPGHPDIANTKIPMEVQPGQIVLCSPHGAVKSSDEEVVYYSEFDVVGIYDNEMFQPLHNLILIEKEEIDNKSKSGFALIHNASKPKVGRGKVVCLGTGWKNMDGTTIPFHVSVGDTVEYKWDAEREINLQGFGQDNSYVVVSHADILGVLNDA